MRTITDATRWATMPNGSDGLHVIDIVVDRPESGHVASVASFQALARPAPTPGRMPA